MSSVVDVSPTVQDHGAGLGRSIAELLRTTDRCVYRRALAQPPLLLSDVAAILTDGRARFPHVTLTQRGVPMPPSTFCVEREINGTRVGGLLDATKVLGLLSDGASVVLNELQTYWPALTTLTAEVQEIAGVEVGAMAFLSPPGLGAFPLHQDPVHVIVIQCAGAKAWTVYEPFPGQDEPGPVARPTDVTSERQEVFSEGDVFSMPPNHPHQAASTAGWSLHVSLTLKRVDALTTLRNEVRRAMEQLRGTSGGVEDLRSAFIEVLLHGAGEGARPDATDLPAVSAALRELLVNP